MSSSLPTEITIRDFLSKALEQRAVKVTTEWSFSTPIGRLVPDMLLRNGADYVVETKLGAESKLLDAMVRLYDYSKYTEAKGAFAVLFPEELRRPWNVEILEKIATDPKLKYVVTAIFKDFRPSQRFVGNLSEVADWIASQVLKPLAVETDTSFAIKVLTEAVDSMTLNLKSLKTQDIEEIFGGKTVFENILQYEEGHYPFEEMRQAATYLLVNQIIFYHVLSRANKDFEAIDETAIARPSDLLKYFERVLQIDYTSVFGFDVASKLPESAVCTIKKIVAAIKALAPEKIGHDVLGKVFHELIPFNIRKAVAAFYTNNEAADLLANLSVNYPDSKVMDLACGSGTLLVAAYHRKKTLLKLGGKEISAEDHRKFLEHDLTGIDIMPFAAHLAVMHLSLQALLHETEKVRIAVWDSTELRPNMDIPAIYSELRAAYRRPTLDMFKDGEKGIKRKYIQKGAVTMQGIGGQQIHLEKADVIIMNPPFTRGRRLPSEYKKHLKTRFRHYKTFLPYREFGLYGYFILLANDFLKENGKLAFVLPATVLRVQSMACIRDFLLDHYKIETIISTTERAAFSENAQFREILLVAQKNAVLPNNSTCSIVKLKKLPRTEEQAKDFASLILKESSKSHYSFENNLMSISIIKQKDLKKVDNLFSLIAATDESLERAWSNFSKIAESKLSQMNQFLKESKGELLRGVENKFGRKSVSIPTTYISRLKSRAKKTDDVWIVLEIHKEGIDAENLSLPGSHFIPFKSLRYGLRRLSGVQKMNIAKELDFVIVDTFEDYSQFFDSKPKTLQNLGKWKRYVDDRQCNLALSWRFDISASGTCILAFYSKEKFTPTEMMRAVTGLTQDDAKLLALWFNSSFSLLWILKERVETRGAFLQIPGFVLDVMPVIDTRKLSKIQKEKLLKLFDEISQVTFPSIMEQLKNKFPTRVNIDSTFLELFGYAKQDIDVTLNCLYQVIVTEIAKLKTLMEG